MEKSFFFVLLLLVAFTSYSQSARLDSLKAHNRSFADLVVARRLSQKMKDTLGLSDSVRARIYGFTLQVQQTKGNVINQYHGSSLLPQRMEKLENFRDSLYATALTTKQYQVYRAKKRTLVFNN